MRHQESEHQIALFEWASLQRLSELKHPIYPSSFVNDYLFSIPNGGKRNAREAARLKLEGVKAGIPDVMFALPVGVYAGLFIELKNKNPKGRVTEYQKQSLKKLGKVGYLTVVCYGVDEAIDCIKSYLNNEVAICETMQFK